MTNHIRTIPLGNATICIINVGDLIMTLSEAINVPESEWRPRYAAVFEQSLRFPSQCIHMAVPGASVLVDANDYAVAVAPDSPFLPPNYQPPPGLIAQLSDRGVRPEDVTHVVITHAHFDHYAGLTIERDGEYVPRFPNARCFLGRADWEDAETQEASQDANSLASRTFGVLHRLGLLELVEGDRDLTPEVRIIAAPGETKGHQIVRVESAGQVLYCLGDLYHHTIEVEQPTWMVEWANADANLASRRRLMQAALAENALLVATHIPEVGRLERAESSVRWIGV